MFVPLLFTVLQAAESPVGREPTLSPNVPVVVAEGEVVSRLSSLGPPAQVAILTANKPQKNALLDVLGANGAGHPHVQAGSASEATAALKKAGHSCGVFAARQGDSWRLTAVGTCEAPPAAAAEPVPTAQP
jgi:hypothetical protein